MNASEILDKAADIITEQGWTQEAWYETGEGQPEFLPPEVCPVCSGGAINVAAGYCPDLTDPRLIRGQHLKAIMEFARRLDSSFNQSPEMDGFDALTVITGWNDEPGRAAEQVIAELRAAAQAEREAGR